MKRILLIVLVAIFFHSCKIGKNYKGTEFVQPASYTQEDPGRTVASDSVNTDSLELSTADLLWWNLYDDPVLDTLIVRAMNNNRDVLIAAENVLQGRLFLKNQNAELLPKFDAQGQVQRGNFLLNNIGETQNLILGSASAN